jgi:hypothetical protein
VRPRVLPTDGATSAPASYPSQQVKVARRAIDESQAKNDANWKGNERARRAGAGTRRPEAYPAQTAAQDEKALADKGEHRATRPGAYVVDSSSNTTRPKHYTAKPSEQRTDHSQHL